MARTFVRLLVLVIALALSSTAAAANRAFVAKGYRLPPDSSLSEGIEIADFNGDGHQDLVFANRAGNRLLLNRGNGYFDVSPGLPSTNETTMGVDSADVDNDGDLDLVFANFYGNLRLYLNDGLGQFANAFNGAFPLWTQLGDDEVVFGDVNGDGNQDLFVGRAYQPNLLLLGDGAGHFTDASAQWLPPVADPAANAAYGADLGDVDGDGDLDLFVANYGTQDRLYLNEQGTFIDVTATNLPVDTAASTYAVFEDMDRDGDLDLLVARYGQKSLYINNGAGRFSDQTALLPVDNDWTESMTARDVDGDGDKDIICTGYSIYTGHAYPANKLWRNDGAAGFTDVSAIHFPPTFTATGAAFADLDGDGREELVLAAQGQDAILANDGTGVFTNVTIAGIPIERDMVGEDGAVGDIDGDGRLDVVVAGYYHSVVYLADGLGNLVEGPAFPGTSPATGVALGDIDQDGDLDVFLAGASQDTLYRNDGPLGFTNVTAQLPPHASGMGRAKLADVDGDGDMDLIVGRAAPQLFLNDGTGTFSNVTAVQLATNVRNVHDVAVADVDGDGDLDLLFAVYQGQNRLFINNGSGTFTDATAGRIPAATSPSVSIVAGDVNGDGHVDFVIGVQNNLVNRLFINDGTGVFTDVTSSNMPATWGQTFGLALGDVDGDGDLDLAGSNYMAQNHLYLNDGTGHFTDVTATWLPADKDATRAACFIDPDGDGDLDLVFVGGAQTRNYTNVLLSPLAHDQAVATQEDLSVAITLSATNDNGGPPTFTVLTGPAFGTLGGAAPNLSYSPNANFFGSDSFTFKASAGGVDSNSATIAVSVTPVNDPPTAADDAFATNEDTPLTATVQGVFGNDADVEGGPLSAVLGSGPSHGMLMLNADGSFIFTPALNYNGTDSFTYNASDGQATSGLATVTLTITSVNDVPTANAGPDQTAKVGQTVTASGAGSADVDGTIVSYTWNWGDGSPDGSGVAATHIYATAGTKTITMTATDDSGATAVDTAEFQVSALTVTPTAGPNGTIDPTTPQALNYNQTTAFAVTPEVGYHVLAVTGCNGSLNGNTYTTGPISADCSVTANFQKDPDTTPPIIIGYRTPEANVDGWNNTDVTVYFTASDEDSGIATFTGPTVVSTEGAGQQVVGIAVDREGNSATFIVSNINIDKTAPTLDAGSDVTVIEMTPVVLSTPTVNDNLDPNPVVTSNAPASFPVGATTVTVTAKDRAGNVASDSLVVTVLTTQDYLLLVKAAINALPPESFRNNDVQRKNAFSNKIDAVISIVDAARSITDPATRNALLAEAINKMENDIQAKMDDCRTSGTPDANDWIIDCAAQSDLNRLVDLVLAALNNLRNV